MQNSQKSSQSDDQVELNEINVDVEEVKDSDVIKSDEKSSDQSDKSRDEVDISKQTRPQGFFLSQETQKTIMQIIQTLRNNRTPDAAQQLFMTLSETSQSIQSANEQLLKKKEVESESSQVDSDVADEEIKQVEAQDAHAILSIDDQLKMLLQNLDNNTNLKRGAGSPKPAVGLSQEANAKFANGEQQPPRVQGMQQSTSQQSSDGQGSTLRINSAYALINEVIMHPSIMWNRQFFYSLGAMPSPEQELMHEWFTEMNEKQKIYIYEIERANEQLKATAARLFAEKGLSREHADIFLKKVSFMENRDYFKLKRRQVHGSATNSSEDSNSASNEAELQESAAPAISVSIRKKNQPFFDNITSSCRINRLQRRGGQQKNVRFNLQHQEQEVAEDDCEERDRGEDHQIKPHNVWRSYEPNQQAQRGRRGGHQHSASRRGFQARR